MASRVLVVGSGAIGLRTSLELLRRNVKVILQSPRPPCDASTCSQGAGGLWMPYHCDDPRTDRWALETLDELHHEATEQSSNPLVELIHTIMLKRNHEGPIVNDFIADDYKAGQGGSSPLPEWTTDSRLGFQHLTAEMLSWQNQVHKLRIPSQSELLKLGYLHAWHFQAPIVNAPRMLERMLDEVAQNENTLNVNVETNHYYSSVDEMAEEALKLDCDAVVNCTGLGAAQICNDQDLVGGRGVTLLYDRHTSKRKEFIHETTGLREISSDVAMEHDAAILTEEAPWGTNTEPCYMIPRGDVLLVGGSYLEGDTETKVRPHERQRLVENARALGIDTDQSEPICEWAGFRPVRNRVRCEVDEAVEKVKVVHNYGHGGSGWTVFVGAAKETVKLLGHG